MWKRQKEREKKKKDKVNVNNDNKAVENKHLMGKVAKRKLGNYGEQSHQGETRRSKARYSKI